MSDNTLVQSQESGALVQAPRGSPPIGPPLPAYMPCLWEEAVPHYRPAEEASQPRLPSALAFVGVGVGWSYRARERPWPLAAMTEVPELLGIYLPTYLPRYIMAGPSVIPSQLLATSLRSRHFVQQYFRAAILATLPSCKPPIIPARRLPLLSGSVPELRAGPIEGRAIPVGKEPERSEE